MTRLGYVQIDCGPKMKERRKLPAYGEVACVGGI